MLIVVCTLDLFDYFNVNIQTNIFSLCRDAGFVYDATKNYDDSFHVGGVMMILAGLLFCLLHLPYFKRVQKRNEQAKASVVEPIKVSLLEADAHTVSNGAVAV